jgi:hypothetical protein
MNTNFPTLQVFAFYPLTSFGDDVLHRVTLGPALGSTGVARGQERLVPVDPHFPQLAWLSNSFSNISQDRRKYGVSF